MSKEPEKVDDLTEAATICGALSHRRTEEGRPEEYKNLDYPTFACWPGGDRPKPKAARKKSLFERLKSWLTGNDRGQ